MIVVRSELNMYVYSHYIESTPVSYSGSMYNDMDEWCVDTFKHTTRNGYNRFQFNNESELNWFLLKWS